MKINSVLYALHLHQLEAFISPAGFFGLREFITATLDALNAGREDEFVAKINSEQFWGGAGSVSDIWLNDENTQLEFDRCLKELLFQMERDDILGKRASKRVKLFRSLGK